MLVLPTDLTGRVIGAAIEVHRHTGPGLLESSYQHCLAHEFALSNLPFREQVAIPVRYKGVDVDCRYRADFLVDDRLVVEIKCVEQVPPIAEAQMITYMRLLGVQQGLLINFNVRRLVDGVRRFVDTRGAWRPAVDPLIVESPLSDPSSDVHADRQSLRGRRYPLIGLRRSAASPVPARCSVAPR